jgi:bacterioferritin-associated ferredoxin
MIVCSCNVLSDHDVREAARGAVKRSTSHVYGCLGCSAQCGRCARTIRKLIDETLGGAKLVCPVGCACALHAAGGEPTAAHSHANGHNHTHAAPHRHAARRSP